MLYKVDPCLELVRLFARFRRRRIRNFKLTRKLSDVRGCYNSVSREYELSSLNNSPYSTQDASDNLTGLHTMGLRKFHDVRTLVILLGLVNLVLCLLSTYVAITAASEECPKRVVVAASMVTAGAGLRILWMVGMGITQAVTAAVMISGEVDSVSKQDADTVPDYRQSRRRWYKWWLAWSRIGFVVTGVQVLGAAYLTFLVATKSANYFAYSCSGGAEEDPGFQLWLVVAPVLGWGIALAQCCVGSDVIAWRSLYHDHDEAWRAHYREMFDYGIREFMCCLGRRQYLSQLDKDEVDSVAALLGDLVAYRARGASHLEVVAGVALLREQKVQTLSSDEGERAPESLLREATRLHPYAVAAYTGFLLDVGRNPFTWLCVWLRRQGILTFWNRNRRPKLEGDNWWRGHAAAFLRHAQVPPEALRKGRISQTNRETVYFVVILHHLRTVVVAIRGTETPEDLLTDGLGRECVLSDSDLLGLLKGDGIPDGVKKQLEDTKPHFCHVGVIQAARELSMQLDNLAEDESAEQAVNDCPSDKVLGDSEVSLLGQRRHGLLTEILGPGGECEGYSLRFVGHSLGGSIAALTALRLYKRYPELHVFAYGLLPCVDAVTADACASFVTSVIYNDEFSSRLSVAAIMRLRAAALRALAAEGDTDAASLAKLAWSIFGSSEQTNSSNVQPECVEEGRSESSRTEITQDETAESRENPAREHLQQQRRKEITGSARRAAEGAYFKGQPDSMGEEDRSLSSAGEVEHRHPGGLTDLDLLENGMPKDVGDELIGFRSGSDLQALWPVEMFVPGLVIHLVKEDEPTEDSKWQAFNRYMGCCEQEKARYSALLKDRKSFRDVVVSPNMFLDHAPWRCQHAMNEILKKMEVPIKSSGSSALASELV